MKRAALVEPRDDFLGLRTIEEFHEGEPSGTARLAVDGNHDLGRIAHAGEVRLQVRFSRPVGACYLRTNEQPRSILKSDAWRDPQSNRGSKAHAVAQGQDPQGASVKKKRMDGSLGVTGQATGQDNTSGDRVK